MTAGTRRILLGQISQAHGIRGEVLIRTHTASPEDIAAYGALSDEAGTRTFALKGVRATGKGVVARIAGVDDRNAAEALAGTMLYVARETLPAAEAGAYYHADLIGLAAHDESGRAVGRVLAVHNFGAGDVIEIELAGTPGRTELLPFSDAFVPVVDIAAQTVVVRLPPADDAEA